MKRDVGILKYSPDLDSELFSAYIAFVETDTVALASEFPNALDCSAVGAYGALGPEDGLHILVSSLFGVESWIGNY